MLADLFKCKNKNCTYEKLEDDDLFADDYTYVCPKCGEVVSKVNVVDRTVYLFGR